MIRSSVVWRLLVAVLLLGMVSGCEQGSAQPAHATQTGFTDILQRKVLRVVTRNAPTTYFEGAVGAEGFEYELVRDFADSLGLELELVVKHSIVDVLDALAKGEADIAAAGLTQTESRQDRFLQGPVYYSVEQQLVCRRGKEEPRQLADLVERDLVVIADSSYVERLQQIARINLPELQWQTDPEVGTEVLLHRVARGEIDCTIADSNIVHLNQRYLPNLRVVDTLTEPQSLRWLLPKGATELKQSIAQWLVDYREQGRLREVESHYYAHIPNYDYVDLRAYHRRIEERLPRYQEMFEVVAERYGIPWQLLAAQAYQESHWNPKAKSPTGVRGMMMLTQNTAQSVGVTNRLDARQSIEGGARYLKKMMDRIPESVTDNRQRLQFAMAAYNVGMGHVHDARTLTRKLGKNPDNWLEVREVLPLLAQKKYYKELRYGYARGWEPVAYVDRVRHYYSILLVRLGEPGVVMNSVPKPDTSYL
ncbi:membrane-bound lytic murein transglycosylase MltF [Aestuariirhabdus sp. Z084]|uniref:membrane-bound lytic murein transglycosylase MltF n=1 Tax=Aestuariirhabdus haliotis TaxID=2918751 RepID=UPI00201B3E89|nr:membrane-bound lytic murein transglycosylase MltF [Aestuariirhabdus haliotis]MCL6417687.1 membrane-bound lytic murein transglycosylase MltF [Aestuariirhabdus haliotis]MCL6421626.1 membrane-bound lytic murein transglycosylase MltF [Aestuariirhabdus haliotis]